MTNPDCITTVADSTLEWLKASINGLLANFAPGVPDRGYMEALMSWWLLYRSENELSALLAEIPDHEIDTVSVFRDPTSAIAFCLVTRR